MATGGCLVSSLLLPSYLMEHLICQLFTIADIASILAAHTAYLPVFSCVYRV